MNVFRRFFLGLFLAGSKLLYSGAAIHEFRDQSAETFSRITVFLVNAQTAWAHNGASTRLLTVQRELARALFECPGRVWPSISWKEASIILTENGRAFRVTPSGLAPDQLYPSEQPKPGVPFTFTYEPQMRLVVHTETLDSAYAGMTDRKIGDFVTQTAIHEGFHHFEQLNVPNHVWYGLGKYAKDALIAFPMKAAPFYYYHRLIENLRAFIHGGNGSSVRKAKFWYDKIKNENPEFFAEILGGAVLEGSATYVEIIGTIIAMNGCQISEDEIYARIASNPSLLPMGIVRSVNHAALMYEYAPYIYLALRKLNLFDRFAEVTKSGEVLEALFAGIKAENDADFEATRTGIQGWIDRLNSAHGKDVERIIADYLNPDNSRFSFTESDIDIWSFGLKLKFSSYGFEGYKSASFKVQGRAFDRPLLKAEKDPCGEDRRFFIGRGLEEVSPARPKSKKIVDGRTWYCF